MTGAEPDSVGFDGVPFALEWLTRPPSGCRAGSARRRRTRADGLVHRPDQRSRRAHGAGARGTPPAGDFTWEAHVVVDGDAMFDAAGLFVYDDDDHWAKLAVEMTAAGPTIVSVVTDTFSDDCNSTVLAQSSAWLRLARVGEAIAFHTSDGGGRWELIRVFRPRARRHASASSARPRPATGAPGASTQSPSRPARSPTFATAADRRPEVVSPPPPRPATAARARARSGRCRREPSRSSPRPRAGPPALPGRLC